MYANTLARPAIQRATGEIPQLSLYLPQKSRRWLDTALLVRTSGDAEEMKAAIRTEARALELALRLWLNSMEEVIAGNGRVSGIRAMAWLATGL